MSQKFLLENTLKVIIYQYLPDYVIWQLQNPFINTV